MIKNRCIQFFFIAIAFLVNSQNDKNLNVETTIRNVVSNDQINTEFQIYKSNAIDAYKLEYDCFLCVNQKQDVLFNASVYATNLKRKLENYNLNRYDRQPIPNESLTINLKNAGEIFSDAHYITFQTDLTEYLPKLPDISSFCPVRGF